MELREQGSNCLIVDIQNSFNTYKDTIIGSFKEHKAFELKVIVVVRGSNMGGQREYVVKIKREFRENLL